MPKSISCGASSSVSVCFIVKGKLTFLFCCSLCPGTGCKGRWQALLGGSSQMLPEDGSVWKRFKRCRGFAQRGQILFRGRNIYDCAFHCPDQSCLLSTVKMRERLSSCFFRACTRRQRLYTTWENLNLHWYFTTEDKSCVLKYRSSDWVSRKHRRP